MEVDMVIFGWQETRAHLIWRWSVCGHMILTIRVELLNFDTDISQK